MLALLSQRNVWLQRRPGEAARNAQWHGGDTFHWPAREAQKVWFTDEEGAGKRRSGRVIPSHLKMALMMGPFRINSYFVTHQKRNSDAAYYSPPLVPHAPRLSHAALLPHFYHACEGLHTWLPLSDQRHLPLYTHIGPGTKTGWKQTWCRRVIQGF